MNKKLSPQPTQTEEKEQYLEMPILPAPPNIPVTISAPANENVPHHMTEESQNIAKMTAQTNHIKISLQYQMNNSHSLEKNSAGQHTPNVQDYITDL